MRLIRGLNPDEKKLRELVFFFLEKNKLWEDFIAAFQYLKEAYRKTGKGFFIK